MGTEIMEVNGNEVSNNGAILTMIERVCKDPQADLSKLEKMLDLQERILNRDAEQAFSASFARMQAEIPVVVERGKIVTERGGSPRSTYATLEDIVDAVRPVLTRHGFGINFKILQEGTQIKVTATLRHELGHSESTDFVCVADNSGSKNTVQAIGSTISYGKRYALCALLNIATRGEDDNGRASQTISIEQTSEIDNAINALSDSKEYKPKFLEYMGVRAVTEILAVDLPKARMALNVKKSGRKPEPKKDGAQ